MRVCTGLEFRQRVAARRSQPDRSLEPSTVRRGQPEPSLPSRRWASTRQSLRLSRHLIRFAIHRSSMRSRSILKSKQRLLTGTLCHTSQQPPSLGGYNPSYKTRSLKTRGLQYVT